MKRAIVLSGGGARASIQVGVLRRFHEAGITIDKCFGASGGAINSKVFCEQGIDVLEATWRAIESQHDVFRFNPATLVVESHGVYDSHPIHKTLDRLNATPKIPYEVAVCNLSDESTVYIPHDHPKITEYTVASSSIPVYVDPMEIDGQVWADGGVLDNIPLSPAIAQGYDQIIVILCWAAPQAQTNDGWQNGSYLHVGLRTFDAMRTRLLLQDLKTCQQINQGLIEAAGLPSDSLPHPLKGKRVVDVHVIAPTRTVLDTLDFTAPKISAGIDHGYEIADAFIKQSGVIV